MTLLSQVGPPRPGSVMLAATLQALTAATFLVMPTLTHRYGAEAQKAAEADVLQQGFPAEILERNQVSFREGAAGLLVSVGIALFLLVLGSPNLAGNEAGRILSFLFQPLLFLVGGFITFQQAFATRLLGSAFERSGDETLTRVDVKSFVNAAVMVFPPWFLFVVRVRFLLTTVGSILVVVLLAVR